MQSLQTRTLPIWRLFLTPAVFITLGLARVVASLHEGPQAGLAWLLAGAFGAALALAYAPRILTVDRRRASVTRAGSPVPLVRNVVVFLLQAGSAVLATIPQAASWRIVLSCAISGASAGYFLGWVALALRSFLSGSSAGGRGAGRGAQAAQRLIRCAFRWRRAAIEARGHRRVADRT